MRLAGFVLLSRLSVKWAAVYDGGMSKTRKAADLTFAEVAERFRVACSTVRRWIADGDLRSTAATPGRFTMPDVLAFENARAVRRPRGSGRRPRTDGVVEYV